MAPTGKRFLEDFLLPALNEEKYGDLLKWIDRDKCYFSIRWNHKNTAQWNVEDIIVFQDWDKLKGHYHPEVQGYYIEAKQRFRAVLSKLKTVRKLHCEDKHVKIYQLVLDNDKSKGDIIGRAKVKMPRKEEHQKSLSTSVICENASYIAKPKSEYPEEVPPSSPTFSVKSENSDNSDELAQCIEEYQLAQRRQMMLSNKSLQLRRISPKSENYVNEKRSLADLRESKNEC